MFQIEGKHALVTGGANGIGLEIVNQLLKSNISKVVIFDINDKAGEKEEKMLNDQYGQGRVIFKRVNIANGPQLEGAFDNIMKQIGRLDILVNNAGVFIDKQWEFQVDLNLNGMFRGSLLGLKYMGKDEGRAGGIIINIASVAGLHPYDIFPGYGATKAGILHASRVLGAENHFKRTGVRVVALCPGGTESELIDINKMNALNNKFLGPAYYELAKEFVPTVEFQKRETVGKAAIDIVQRASSGTVWVSENNEPVYEIEFKHYSDMKKQ